MTDHEWAQRPKLTAIDLFSGAGGLSIGLVQSGFSILFANDVRADYLSTYKANHPGTLAVAADIRDLDAGLVQSELSLAPGQLDLLAGGPPCQGFSINAPLRRSSDRRNHLFLDFCRFADQFQPRVILIENVPGLVSFGGGDTLSSILANLDGLGYRSEIRIVYAPHFGVPQMRWRTVVIGLKQGDPSLAFPEPQFDAPARVNFTSSHEGKKIVHLPSVALTSPYVTVRSAIDDLPALGNGESSPDMAAYATAPQNWYQKALRHGSPGVLNHVAPKLAAVNLERLKHIKPGGSWRDIPHELLPAGMQRARRSDHTQRYGRADPDGLSSTILTKCDPHWGAFFHYQQDRAFTVREAGRLQSFPDWFRFEGTRGSQYEQVGNAVPPLLAKALGARLAALLQMSKVMNFEVR